MPPKLSKTAEDSCAFPACKGIIRSVKWIQCDNCEKWYHYPCVKVTAKDAANEYICSACCTEAMPNSLEEYFICSNDYYQCSVTALAELRTPECYSKSQASLAKLVTDLEKPLISSTLTIIRKHFSKDPAHDHRMSVVLSLTKDNSFVDQIQHLIFGSFSSVDFNQLDSHVTHRYISILFRKIFGFLMEKRKADHHSSWISKPLTDLEGQGFRYVAGSVVRKSLRNIKKKLSVPDFLRLYEALVKETPDRHETEKYIAGVDRGALYYIQDECYNYFLELDKTIDVFYSNLDFQKRLELAMEAVQKNHLLKEIWETRLGLDSRYETALRTIVQTTITNRGNVLQKQLDEANNLKISAKRKLKGDVALRQKLQK